MNERAKAEFMKIWTERVQRDYADAMLEWLEREQLAAYAENLQNGVIEGDPDDMEQQLEQYATVVTQEEMEQQERARLAQEEDHLLG